MLSQKALWRVTTEVEKEPVGRTEKFVQLVFREFDRPRQGVYIGKRLEAFVHYHIDQALGLSG